MSQISVTGEVKIRDIQGPVVANDGVVTALDGAANQYVRGDGTLAVFPTSTGGGSSVSYYLNGSVSQGTIGGVDYKELSKDPIIGTNADFTISSNGYIASFITDANDPDSVIIPGGNWNVEFYFSASSGGGSPYFYVEVYKYDGTTFTLVGSNQSVPEYITAGTDITSYYGAVPIPTTNLSVTDRIAVRIYVVPAGRTITLHTQNGHLCQIVTTFSKGILSINGLTDQSQYLATGTSGTDFNIASSGDTHTFNIPSASASNRGLITTGTQTIAGAKTFINTATFQDSAEFYYGVLLKDGSVASKAGYFSISSLNSTTLSLLSSAGRTANLILPSSTQSYTFPNATGTIALTSNLASYVPYTGATTFVNLGTQLFYSGGVVVENAGNGLISTDGSLSAGKGIFLTNTVSGGQWSSGTTNLVARNSGFLITRSAGGGLLIFDSAVTYDYTFPSSNGTIALTSNLSSYLPLSGGTLTGALSGTSATFSSSVQAANMSIGITPQTDKLFVYNASGTNTGLTIQQDGTGDIVRFNGNSGANRFNITQAGVATFSDNIMIGAGKYLGYSASAYMTPEDNIQGARIKTGGGFIVESAGATFSSSGNPSLTINGTDGAYTSLLYLNAAGGGSSKIFANGGANTLSLGTNNSEKLTITSGGNVGIGTSSPNALLEVAGTSANTDFRVSRSVSSSTYFYIKAPGGSPSTATMGVNGTDVMALTSGGDVLINKSSLSAASVGVEFEKNSSARMTVDGGTVLLLNRLSSDGTIVDFRRSTSQVGTISVTTSSTSYNTSSDYRLKQDLKDYNGLNIVSAIKTYDYEWKADESRAFGVLAHELAEVLPYAVNGEKDGERMQGVDYSKIVPVLVKAIQELNEKIKQIENIINPPLITLPLPWQTN